MNRVMDPARWQKLQDLFAAARALQGDAREELLRSAGREDHDLVDQVRSLLEADRQPGIMDEVAPKLASVAALINDVLPDRIGAYRITGELGRGGMGVVYRAERADGQFNQRVAIKLIHTADADDPLHQRFLAERQILAGLIHPNIARLLDGGFTDDGRPYVVLEYVDGLPITTYSDRHRLDVRERLRLFMDVCAAVQHAHQNLVIHRDLKPSNILVSSDGRVHLLDFGIAKLINPMFAVSHMPITRMDLRAMTPEYASPEQVRGDSLTTASDIYALGVLLYELLSGHRPYQLTTSSPAEIATAVCEQDPQRPSLRAGGQLTRQLAGDLDSIVMMAMRKEPGRRYASADMMRQDIERHLTGMPVMAHRGDRRYRIEKFLRRHRVEAAAAVMVTAALLTGLTVAVSQSRRASRERDRAAQALAESQGVTDFLMQLFGTGDNADASPVQLTALELLKRGAARANELSDQPVVHARLLDVVGQMSLQLGQYDDAQRWLEQAVDIRRKTLGPRSLDLASSLIHLAQVHRVRADYTRARPLVDEALEIRQAVLPPAHADIADAYYELGWLIGGPGQEELHRKALAILPDTGASAQLRVTVLQALSTNLRRQGRLSEAVSADRDAVRVAQQAFGAEHATTGNAMIHLADQIRDIEQDYAGAQQLYRRGLDIVSRQLGENSIRLLHGLHSLGTMLTSLGNREAEPLLRRAVAIREAATGPDHPSVAEGLQFLSAELARQQRFTEAEALARRALELSERTLGPRHRLVTDSRMPHLADVLNQAGRHAEADSVFRTALRQTQGSITLGEMHRVYGRMLLRRRDYVGAEQQLLQSLSVIERVYGNATHPNVQETRRALMSLYEQMGKPELVEKYRVPAGRYIPY